MRTSCTKCDAVVIVLCAVLVLIAAGAVDESGREQAFRQSCRKNLASLGKAMLIYSNDYDDELPKTGSRNNEWVPTLPNWKAMQRGDAFGMDMTGQAKVTVTSSLYLLVKYAETEPEWYVCPSEPDSRAFNLSDALEEIPAGLELIDAWDFGGRYDDRNNPGRHCSYSYHAPFDKYALTVANDPDMAVLADRNPWIDPNRVNDPSLGWTRYVAASESGDSTQIRLGNSDAHQRDGQNVLFLDAHVAFQTSPTCGVDGDNIYTLAFYEAGSEKAKETPPKAYDRPRPANRRDSVLVQELPFALRTPASEDKEKGP